nr:uncharacterized protein LOC117229550 [Megalopta genalis]
MRSSALFSAFILTIVCSLLVQELQATCKCGNLGSGTNPCTCSDTVVKAAKLPKPIFFASPEEINDAAAARNSIFNTNNANTNAYISDNSDTIVISNSDSDSDVISNSDSSETISNNDSNSETITISNNNSPVVTITDNQQISETLELDDSSDSNINIVPSFTPIGDLCYPLPIDSRSGKLIEKTRVIPAYPGKIICNTCNPAAPYEICINTLNGETTTRMLSGPTSDPNSALLVTPSTGTLDKLGFRLGSRGNMNTGIFGGPSSVLSTGRGGSASGAFGGFGALKSRLFGHKNLGLLGRSQSRTFGQNFQSSPRVYNNVLPPLLNIPQTPRTAVISSSSSSFCEDDETTDYGLTDYTYPQIPADAVSLTLAYKNLRAPNVIYRQGKQFVPEDKLSFGHRTVPNEENNEKKIPDIPEEKLVTVDKPVVELKIAPPRTVVIGSYDEREEAKLAELEAIERESITQEEVLDQGAEGLLTYRDLGYAPVGSFYANSRSYSGIINGESDDSMEEPCGSLGPPVPGYIPGSVIVQQGFIRDKFANSRIGEIIDRRLVGCPN